MQHAWKDEKFLQDFSLNICAIKLPTGGWY